MKDTIFIGQKNNMYYNTSINKNRFDRNIRSSFLLASHALAMAPSKRILYKNNIFSFLQNQRRYFHIRNIRAILLLRNRIGKHNENVLSVIIGSLLGDAYANKRSLEGVRICYRQSDRHQEYFHNFLNKKKLSSHFRRFRRPI
jgi:hypothetical protein